MTLAIKRNLAIGRRTTQIAIPAVEKEKGKITVDKFQISTVDLGFANEDQEGQEGKDIIDSLIQKVKREKEKNKQHKEHIAQLHAYIKGLIDPDDTTTEHAVPLTAISQEEVNKLDLMKHEASVIRKWMSSALDDAVEIMKASLKRWSILSDSKTKVDKLQMQTGKRSCKLERVLSLLGEIKGINPQLLISKQVLNSHTSLFYLSVLLSKGQVDHLLLIGSCCV